MTTAPSALGLAAALRAGELGAVEAARDLLERLDRLAPVVGAVAATDPERTLAAARCVEVAELDARP